MEIVHSELYDILLLVDHRSNYEIYLIDVNYNKSFVDPVN